MKRRWLGFSKRARSGGALASSNSSALILPATPPMTTNAVSDELRDIKQPLPISSSLWWLWLVFALVGLAVAAWMFFKKKKTVGIPVPLFIPPHRRAKERLRAATDLLSDPYKFCSLVSDVVRVY